MTSENIQAYAGAVCGASLASLSILTRVTGKKLSTELLSLAHNNLPSSLALQSPRHLLLSREERGYLWEERCTKRKRRRI